MKFINKLEKNVTKEKDSAELALGKHYAEVLKAQTFDYKEGDLIVEVGDEVWIVARYFKDYIMRVEMPHRPNEWDELLIPIEDIKWTRVTAK